MSEWQPIETAPKDGTEIRLRATFLNYYQYGVGSFAVHMGGDPPEWRMKSKDIGWCRANPPTHWQPL